MKNLESNIVQIQKELQNTGCQLVAVSKTKPVSLIQEAYDLGLRHFGENKVQELASKAEVLPKDICWHHIGHLQRNKVKYIAPFVHLIHAVDSLRLLEEINKRAAAHQRVIGCLLQVHIAQEETKFGLDETALFALLEDAVLPSLSHIHIKGLMGMATFTDNQAQVQAEFASLKTLFDSCKARFSAQNISWEQLSMGMSGDYPLAIEAGSTLVRVGSAIFGNRG